MKNKPTKILFDANPLVNGNKSGVGYYGYYLLEALAENYPDEVEIYAHYFNFLGKKRGLTLPVSKNIKYVESRFIPGKILSLTRKLGFQLPFELFFKRTGDIAIFVNFVSLPSILKTPYFVAVHDLCYEEVPEYVAEKNRKFLHNFVPNSVKNAARVITISDETKKSIQHNYGISRNKIIITPIPPFKPVKKSVEDMLRLKISGKYILFMGNMEPRKNFINLVEAYVKLPHNLKQKYQLVLAGGSGWKNEILIERIKELQSMGEPIVMTGYVSDTERYTLYTNASLFVLPSHYEGFGMPVLEAMAYGIPTAISNIPVFHEVAGDNSLYFDKDNPKSIKDTIEKILTDDGLAKKMSSKGMKHAQKYSWDNVASDMFREIKRVTENNG